MSHGTDSIFRRLNATPLVDLLHGRLTARLDWKSKLAASGLPDIAAALIDRVVRQMRLSRLEKVAVAEELIAHFEDALAAGGSAAGAIEQFGGERLAAKLMERAKRRNRSILRRAWSITWRLFAGLIVVYALVLARFWTGRPTIAVDYVAKLNEPILRTPPGDRAWPLWREAILACSERRFRFSTLEFSVAISSSAGPWLQKVRWLDAHAQALELGRMASRKPVLGFLQGPGGSSYDPELFDLKLNDPARFYVSGNAAGIWPVKFEYLTLLREMAMIFFFDARLAAERGESQRFEADLDSMVRLADQVRNEHGFVIFQFVALGIDELATAQLQNVLSTKPEVLSDDALVRLAHVLSRPRVAADLMSLSGERDMFADALQKAYTDDGHGDGRLSPRGLEILEDIRRHVSDGRYTPEAVKNLVCAPSMMLAASRAELSSRFDRLLERKEADLRIPLRSVARDKSDADLLEAQLKQSLPWESKYGFLAALYPHLERIQSPPESYLGFRDGTVVGIALELHRRHFGKYPAALTELVPQFLPAIPADRFTGEPVKYRLIDGRPLVYSVGPDHKDDGGKCLADKEIGYGTHPWAPNRLAWAADPATAPRGDWILYGPGLMHDLDDD